MSNLQTAVVFLSIVANIVCFVLMGIDKWRARHGRRRIPEIILFLSAGCFGGLGGVLAMHIFHHKTKHLSFNILFPVFMLIHAYILAKMFYIL